MGPGKISLGKHPATTENKQKILKFMRNNESRAKREITINTFKKRWKTNNLSLHPSIQKKNKLNLKLAGKSKETESVIETSQRKALDQMASTGEFYQIFNEKYNTNPHQSLPKNARGRNTS